MASTTTTHVMVKAPQPELATAIHEWWEVFPFEDKRIRLDRLPTRFWGTFTHRGKVEGEPKEQVVQIYLSIESGAAFMDFDLGGGGYGRNFIKISCLVADPVLGDLASEYLDNFIDWVKNKFMEMGIKVEIPEIEATAED